MASRSKCTIMSNVKVTIPLSKPEAQRVLRMTANPIVTATKNSYKKVVFWGAIRIDVEYVGCVPTQTEPVHLASFEIPIYQFIKCRRARENMEAVVTGRIDFQHCQLIDSRCIEIYIIAKFQVVRLQYKQTIDSKSCECSTITSSCVAEGSAEEASVVCPPAMIKRNSGWSAWNRRYHIRRQPRYRD